MLDGKISVIMPAYNEARHIVDNIREVVQTLSDLAYDYEIIVVDDGSGDNTYLHAVKVLMQHPEKVRIVRYDVNCGKGNALICGTTYAIGKYVVFLDADIDLHPVQLPVLFEIMVAKDADVVIGSKRHPLSNVVYPPIRRLYSSVYFALVRALFGLPLRDTQTGLKVFKMAVLRKVFPRVLVKRFAFDVEVLALAHRYGFKVVDAPVTLTFRRKYGRIKPHDIFDIVRDTFAIFYRMKMRHYYDTHEDDLPWPSNGHGVREVLAESQH
ncbi:MAG TPA: glycosyltransferase [Verrucomicrobiae bacterium]|jgi:glycosyltransferase involved in cell wall biosynthesis|nr:glycosyltransferase [Verrucomicrobiae bacterium]